MAQQLAKAIAVPGRTPPQRFPSFPALERTAVMGFNANSALTVTSTATNPDANKVMLTRSAFFPLWGSLSVTSTSSAPSWGLCYQTSYIEATTGAQTWDATATAISGAWSKTTTVGPVPEFPNATLGSCDYGVFGIDSGTGTLPWVYIPGKSYVLISLNKSGHPWEANVSLEQWEGPSQVSAYNTSVNFDSGGVDQAGAKAIYNVNPTWLRLKVLSITTNTNAAINFHVSIGASCNVGQPTFVPTGGSNPSAGQWTISGTGTNSAFVPISHSAEWANSILPWKAARLTATAALFTNATKVMNKEGTALWGRLGPSVKNPFLVTRADIATLHPAEKRFMGLEKGCYAYNPPSEDLAEFRNSVYVTSYLTTTLAFPVYRLDDRAYLCHGFFDDPDGNTTLAVNMDWHIEFRSSSTLFNLGVSSTPLENLHTAQLALLKAGFFFENENHAGVISKIISAIGSLHPLLRVAAPLAAGLLQSSSVAVGRKTRTVQATSARGSGIVTTTKRPPARAPRSRKKTKPGTRPRTASARLPPFKMEYRTAASRR